VDTAAATAAHMDTAAATADMPATTATAATEGEAG
jgi:hypothetical protein